MKFKKLSFCFFIAISWVSTVAQADAALRNPSTPLITPDADKAGFKNNSSAGALVLSSIFKGFGKKVAIIGDKEYQEGDSFGGYKLKEINSDHVVLESNGKLKKLALYTINKAGFVIQ